MHSIFELMMALVMIDWGPQTEKEARSAVIIRGGTDTQYSTVPPASHPAGRWP